MVGTSPFPLLVSLLTSHLPFPKILKEAKPKRGTEESNEEVYKYTYDAGYR